MSSTDVVGFFNNLKLCYDFRTDKQVSEEDMIKILEVGRLSPSSFGLEPWKFLVIENKFIINQIYKLARGIKGKEALGDYLVIILSRNSKELEYNSDYVRYIMEEIQAIPEDEIFTMLDKYKIFLEEDHDIGSSPEKLAGWVGKQTYIPLANMVVAAYKLGISACAIEGFHRAELEDYLTHEKIYDRDKYNVSCILSFGYSRESKENITRRRRPFEEVVTWVK